MLSVSRRSTFARCVCVSWCSGFFICLCCMCRSQRSLTCSPTLSFFTLSFFVPHLALRTSHLPPALETGQWLVQTTAIVVISFALLSSIRAGEVIRLRAELLSTDPGCSQGRASQ